MNDLKVELQYSDSTYNTYLIEGLSVKEQNTILNSDSFSEMKSILADILDEYKPGLGTRWHNGYGIYGINHFGGNLLVKVGRSCD